MDLLSVKFLISLRLFNIHIYKKVDQNFNEIVELQNKFNAKFDLSYSTDSFIIGKNSIAIKLLSHLPLMVIHWQFLQKAMERHITKLIKLSLTKLI